jgi:hypothetical protein
MTVEQTQSFKIAPQTVSTFKTRELKNLGGFDSVKRHLDLDK